MKNWKKRMSCQKVIFSFSETNIFTRWFLNPGYNLLALLIHNPSALFGAECRLHGFPLKKVDSPKTLLKTALGKKKLLAERGFDPRTSGLWAQHASTAPLCYWQVSRDLYKIFIGCCYKSVLFAYGISLFKFLLNSQSLDLNEPFVFDITFEKWR